MSLIEGWIRVNVLDTGQKASRRGHGTKAGLHFPPVQNFWLRAGSHVSKNRKKKREKESGKVVGMMG